MENQIVESTKKFFVKVSGGSAESNCESNKSPIMSKGSKSYYKNQEKRIAHQFNYDKKHKEQKKAADAKRYQIKKNQRLIAEQQREKDEQEQAEKLLVVEGFLGKFPRINIDILKQKAEYAFNEEKWRNRLDEQKLVEISKRESDSIRHDHGASRKERIYDKPHRGRLDFHITEAICFEPEESRFGIGRVRIGKEPTKSEISGKQLNHAYTLFFGLQDGDSLVFKDEYGSKCQICFDGSGLDIGNIKVFNQLMAARIETGKKGIELIRYFAEHYSKDGYVRYYRGNKTLLGDGNQ